MSDIFEGAMFNAIYAKYEFPDVDMSPEQVRDIAKAMFNHGNFSGALIEYMLACGRAIATGGDAEDDLKQALFLTGDLSDTIGFVDYDALVRETHKLYGAIVSENDYEEGIMAMRFRLFDETIRETMESLMSAMCHAIEKTARGRLPELATLALDKALEKMEALDNDTLAYTRSRYGKDLNPACEEADNALYEQTVKKIKGKVSGFISSEGERFDEIESRVMQLASKWAFVAAQVNIGHATQDYLTVANRIAEDAGLPENFIEESTVHNLDEITQIKEATMRGALKEMFGVDGNGMDDDELRKTIEDKTGNSRELMDELSRLLNDPNLGLKPSDFGF